MVDLGSLDVMGHCIASDSFTEHMKFLDFPLEGVEEGACEQEEGEDWNAKLLSALGPIPFDFLSRCLNENIVNGDSDLMLNGSETVTDKGGSELIQPPHFIEDTSNTNLSEVVRPLSPISVLEGSNPRTLATDIPRQARSKRPRSSGNKIWASIVLKRNTIKKKREVLGKKATTSGAQAPLKRCSHCHVTHTPQWREGPMGPKTLCNACGVRYRSGRLFPEYRPMASPGFVPSLHSNSHRKVLEMRNKGNMRSDISTGPNDAPVPPRRRVKKAPVHERGNSSPPKFAEKAPIYERENSPPPEFIPMSDYLHDCVLGSEVYKY